MEVKKKIKYIIVTLFVFSVVSSMLIYGSLKQYTASLYHADIASQIMITALDEQLLAGDYLVSSGGRAETQWNALQEKIQGLIAQHPHLHGTREEELVMNIQRDLTSADAIFKQLIVLGDNTFDLSIRKEKEGQLMAELSLRVQEISLASSQLAELNASEASAYLARTIIIFSGMALLFFIALLYSSRIIWSGVNELDTAKAEAQDRQERLNILLQSIGDGVVAIDREWNITLWNKTAVDLTGWRVGEVLGKPMRGFLKFILEHDRKENIAFIEEAMLFGRTGFIEGDTVFITKDGKEVPVEDSAAPIFDKNQEINGAIIVFRDASKAREAMSLRSDFTYAAHQIRTPITKALWLTEGALKASDIDAMKRNVNDAYLSLQSINKLGEELLEASKIDQYLVVPKFEEVVAENLLDEVLKTADEKAKQYGVRVSVSGALPAGTVTTNPKLFKKILAEVLDNAIMYSVSKKPIEVACAWEGGDMLIKVADFGVGITDEQKPLLFTKFFRGSNFDTTKIPGAGLGLYIARAYAGLLGGKIWFDSKEGEGATFFILIPRG